MSSIASMVARNSQEMATWQPLSNTSRQISRALIGRRERRIVEV
jgi:hypothetical protein